MLKLVRRDIICVKRTINGECFWINGTRDIFNSLIQGRCPVEWSQSAHHLAGRRYSTGQFVQYLDLRTNFLLKLSSESITPEQVPRIQLPFLVSPKGLCIILRQVIYLLEGCCSRRSVQLSFPCRPWQNAYIPH